MRKILASLSLSIALAGCSVIPTSQGGQTGSYVPRSDAAPIASSRVSQPRRPSTAFETSTASRQGDQMCLSALGSTGAQFTPLPDRYDGQGCTNLGTVQLIALQSDDADLAIANLGPVTCPVSQAFAGWARFGVDRAARQVFGTRLARIETFGSYACRNVAGSSRRSAHATAEAIDIAAFRLADGRRIEVKAGWDGTASEREFLRLVQSSACRRFETVLGPEYNAAHEDHFHIEGVIEGTSYCR